MRVVFAPDSFKGSLRAAGVAQALADGWDEARPGDDVVLAPMADGGEGTLDAFAAALPAARRMPVTVTGADGEPVDAAWLLLPATPDAPGGTGVVELASTCGIELLDGGLRGWDASTLGFGQAIAAALDHGVSRLALGIGSSASTDGGTGMLTALGARFLDAAGSPVAPGARGLADLTTVELTGLRSAPDVVVMSDVTHPLLGPAGAAAVFGPQKGLDAAAIPIADAGLARLAGLLDADPAAPGAGAAGGTGFALLAWGARLVSGAAHVAELIGLRDLVGGADLVVTGEGSYDGQSVAGKAPALVRALAAEAGASVALVAGRIADDADTAAFAASLSLTALAGSPAAALAHPRRWLRAAGAALAADPPRA